MDECTAISGVREIAYRAEFEDRLHKLLRTGHYGAVALDLYRVDANDADSPAIRMAAMIRGKYIRVGVTEKEIAARLHGYMVMEGADSHPYGGIVLSGARTSMLHGIPSSKAIEYCVRRQDEQGLPHLSPALDGHENKVFSGDAGQIDKIPIGEEGILLIPSFSGGVPGKKQGNRSINKRFV